MREFIPILIITLLIAWIPASHAQYEPKYAKNGMVVSPEPNATEIGVKILRQGGNAVDAAVAVGFALAVTYPAAGNIGGGGFMVAHNADGTSFFLDFREMAPAAATADMYLDKDNNVIDGLSTRTLLASGVPGTVHGLLSAHQDHGNLSRKAVLEPAIKLAKKGYKVSYSLSRSLQSKTERLTKFESTKKIFYPNGKAPAFGDTLIQNDLANTLNRVKRQGIEGFYTGKTAELMEAYMQEHGGIITKDDLAGYTSKYRDPVQFDYKRYQIISPNLPSSGGITLAQILKLIEPYDLKAMGWNSADYVSAIVEAERLAFSDRNHHLGDMDYVDVPIDTLISDEYLNKRRQLISLDKAGSSKGIQHGNPESEQTTHYCVVDKNRNVAAVTYTLNGGYGMGAVVEGAGFLLNNEMDDFSAKPGAANMYGLVEGEKNKIEPGKRMLSSMTPTIVLKDGAFAFTVGTPGGPTIITSVAQMILNQIEFGMNIREAVNAARFHHQWLPDAITHEPFAFSKDTKRLLTAKGYQVNKRGSIGIAAGIAAMENGMLAGYADGRGEGTANGY